MWPEAALILTRLSPRLSLIRVKAPELTQSALTTAAVRLPVTM